MTREYIGADAERVERIIRNQAAEIALLRSALADLRERSVEEGIHHFVNRIDAALEPKPDLRTLLPELAVIRQVMQERKPKPD